MRARGDGALRLYTRLLPPRSLACLQLAEPCACAASQFGGFMYVLGSPGSTVNVTIIDSTITTCSAVAQTTLAVSARHATQQGEGSRVLGRDKGDSGVCIRLVRWDEGIVQAACE